MREHEPQLPIISVNSATKRYMAKAVFENLSLNIAPGKLTLLSGPSGSGKTTLLNMMSAVDRPDNGSVRVNGQDITQLAGRELSAYRAATGQIFQRSGLVAGLTVMENIKLVHTLGNHKINEKWTNHLLGSLGVSNLIKEPATHLSGGEAQRIAVVRALAHRPEIVFADEPTAALDTDSKKLVHETLRSVAEEGVTVVMVSHEPTAADYADEVYEMRDGEITSRDLSVGNLHSQPGEEA